MLLYIFYGEPHNSHVIQGSMISFSFINVETEAWKYGVLPKSSSTHSANIHKYCGVLFFLSQGVFKMIIF